MGDNYIHTHKILCLEIEPNSCIISLEKKLHVNCIQMFSKMRMINICCNVARNHKKKLKVNFDRENWKYSVLFAAFSSVLVLWFDLLYYYEFSKKNVFFIDFKIDGYITSLSYDLFVSFYARRRERNQQTKSRIFRSWKLWLFVCCFDARFYTIRINWIVFTLTGVVRSCLTWSLRSRSRRRDVLFERSSRWRCCRWPRRDESSLRRWCDRLDRSDLCRRVELSLLDIMKKMF